MRRIVIASLLALSAALTARAELIVTGTGGEITLILPPEAGAALREVRLFELDAAGRDGAEVAVSPAELFCDRPQRGVYRALCFTPEAGTHRYRLRGVRSAGADDPGNWRAENDFAAGDFEGDGWWFARDDARIGRTDRVARSGRLAFQADLRGNPVVKPLCAGSGVAVSPVLSDPERTPFLLRAFIRREAGDGCGVTLRLRRFDAEGRYLDDWGQLHVTDGESGEWRECRGLLNAPLTPDTPRLELFMVNLTPGEGMCFQLDDIQLMPMHRLTPMVEFTFPAQEQTGGAPLRFAVKCAPPGARSFRPAATEIRIDGGTFPLTVWLVSVQPETVGELSWTVTIRDSALRTVHTAELPVSGGAAEWTLPEGLPEGAYECTLSLSDGTVETRPLRVTADPFA